MKIYTLLVEDDIDTSVDVYLNEQEFIQAYWEVVDRYVDTSDDEQMRMSAAANNLIAAENIDGAWDMLTKLVNLPLWSWGIDCVKAEEHDLPGRWVE